MANSEENEMTFLDHLEQLRWHIIRSGISIFVFAIAAFFAKDFVWGVLLLGPSQPDFFSYRKLCELGHLLNSSAFCIEELPFIIQSREMTGQFTMHIASSIVIGLICAFPYTFWEIWRFISPGLYPKERRMTRGATFFVSILFAMGILFGYYMLAPLSINFLGNYQVDPSILNEFDIKSYVTTVTMLVLASGLMFQLPIVVYFLSEAGLVTPEIMKSYRRHAIVIILVLSAVLTPPDVISQILMSLPMILLYQASIFISKIVLRGKRKEIAQEKLEENV